eukprot:3413597-Prymnesium_polylepis.2
MQKHQHGKGAVATWHVNVHRALNRVLNDRERPAREGGTRASASASRAAATIASSRSIAVVPSSWSGAAVAPGLLRGLSNSHIARVSARGG